MGEENPLDRFKAGDRVTGTVGRVTDYGVFVDFDGVNGLLHISEMSWVRINHPGEMVQKGQEIEVMVLRVDHGANKLSLGLRQVLPNPWIEIAQNYCLGERIRVKIRRIVPAGAFILLPEGAEVFLPVSEMSLKPIRRPQDVVQEGQEVDAQIIDHRPTERRMVLSMRALSG